MSRVAEPAREAFLYQIWKKREIDNRTLYTIDGSPVTIRERGVQNFDAGPDFINALVETGEGLVRGDVEIHPVAGDWYTHGHHRDPRYNQVVLHVVTMDCPSDFKTLRQDGVSVPTMNLDMYLDLPAEVLEKEEKTPEVKVGHCALGDCSQSFIRQVLESAGESRFTMHVSQVKESRAHNSWDQILYQSLCESLGYAKNQVPFRNLARRLPVDTLWEFLWQDSVELAQMKCQAYLFGAAGLLPSQAAFKEPVTDPDVNEFVTILEDLWHAFPWRNKITPLKPEVWKFFRLRPQNFPTRRIAAAAQLVVRFMDEGFVPGFYRIVQNTELNVRTVITELEALLRVKSSGFWEQHYQFAPVSGNPGSSKWLIGNDRIRDILVNVVLPLLYAYAGESDDHRGANTVLELYSGFPALSENHITRRMRKRLFDGGAELPGPALVRIQQGLIHLEKFHCHEGDCADCIETAGTRN